MKRLFLLLFLLLAGTGWGANWYVDPLSDAPADGGDGTTSATSGANRAEKTLAAALTDALVHADAAATIYVNGNLDSTDQGAAWALNINANKSITFAPLAAAPATSLWTSDVTTHFITCSASGTTITFDRIYFLLATTAANQAGFYKVADSTSSWVFTDCDIIDSSTYFVFYIADGTGADHTITLTNTDITTACANNGALYVFDLLNFTMTGGTFTSTGTSPMMQLAGGSELVKFSGVTFVSTSTGAAVRTNSFAAGTSYVRWLEMDSCTFTDICRAIYSADDNLGHFRFTNNTLTSTTAVNMFHLGSDNVGEGTTDKFYGAYIGNNTFNKTAGASGHLMLLGLTCYGALVENNVMYQADTNDWGIVDKGTGNIVRNNIVRGANALYLSGAQNGKYYNNTLIAYNGGAACYSAGNTEALAPANCRLWNNIFIGTGGTMGFQIASVGGSYYHHDFYVDYNCYFGGSTTSVALDNINYTDLTTLQAKWDVWTAAQSGFTRSTNTGNDEHSLLANPGLRNPAGDDFVPTNNLLLYSGKPDADGRASYIGALHPKVGQPFDKNRWRYSGMTLGGHW